MKPMEWRDPRSWADEPILRALDAILYRWILLFGLPVLAAVLHAVIDGRGWLDTAVHAGVAGSLLAFIGVHLIGRLQRRHGSPDGWATAGDADRSTVAVARGIGWVVVIGAALALVAPLGSLAEPKAFGMEVLLWFPLLFPLYSLAVWCTIDCARDRLGRAADESRQRLHTYWQDVANRGQGGGP